MNCKPGDLAIIIRASEWSGWIVEVVSAAPAGDFTAPDGTPFTDKRFETHEWLIKAPRPFGRRPYTRTCYALCGDSNLRPLPGALETDNEDVTAPIDEVVA